jgi:hypothetical protein
MSLTLSGVPGFTEIPDASFDEGAVASDTDMKALNADAKFAVVRNEQFGGFYCHGETVACPTSGADPGYEYARAELVYEWSIYWTGAATGACNGTQTPPPKGATSGQGMPLQMGFLVDPATGVVSCDVSYFKTAQQDTHDGILWVMVHAQRMR